MGAAPISAGGYSQSAFPRRPSDPSQMPRTLIESGITESALESEFAASSSALGDSDFPRLLSADLTNAGSEIVRSQALKVLPRTLPDKLDWAHDAYKRLWITPKPFPYGGLGSKQMQAIDDLGAAGGRSIKLSASMPSLAAAHASRFEPSLEHPARSLRDYHEPSRPSTVASGVSRWEPRAPSSLATSKLPDPSESRDGVKASLAMSRKAILRDKHAFLGKSC